MYRTGLFVVLMSLLLNGCFFHPKPSAGPEKAAVVKPKHFVKVTKHSVGNFSQVSIQGRMDASVHSGYSKPMVILRGDPRDLQQVVIEREGEALLVHLGKGYPRHGSVKAEIRSRYLNRLNFEGEGRLIGTKLRSNDLVLDLNNSGYTHLGGYLMLSKLTIHGNGLYRLDGVHSQHLAMDISDNAKLEMTGKTNLNDVVINGNGRLSLYWIKGPCLKIRANGHSVVQLAGVVNRLEIELHDKAIFEGRYLRADRAFVKTFDESVARISAVKRQHTLASDHSDIYFYNLSEMRTDFMAFDGSVLDMRSLDLKGMNDYTDLNKWH